MKKKIILLVVAAHRAMRNAIFETVHLQSHVTADIISALEFSHDGEHLATGDKGGRVVLFERSHDQDVNAM